MPKLTIVSREHHAGKKWRRATNYAFAATTALAPLSGVEIARAVLAMPIAFFEHSGRFIPTAVMSINPGHNFFVGPGGHWLGSYVPASLRGYPFQLVVQEGAKSSALAVDEDSGLVVDADGSGEEFFDPHGDLSPALKSVADFLVAVARSQAAMAQAVVVLAEAGLIQPWEIKVRTGGAEEKSIHGLYRINESTLNALSNDTFISLRKASALPLAYAQLISMGQLAVFERLAAYHEKLAQTPSREATSLDEIFAGRSDELIRFD